MPRYLYKTIIRQGSADVTPKINQAHKGGIDSGFDTPEVQNRVTSGSLANDLKNLKIKIDLICYVSTSADVYVAC